MLYISPDDLAKYISLFRSLPVWWQLLIVGGLIAVAFGAIGWRIALGHYRERIETQKVIIDDYREKFKGLSPAEVSEQMQQLKAEATQAGAQIRDLTSMFWRRLTDNEKTIFKEKFAAIGQYRFRIVSAHPADCKELAGDLAGVFESAGWRRVSATSVIVEHGLDDDPLARTSGIRIIVKYPIDNPPGPKVADALTPLVRFGVSFGVGLSSGDLADVVLFIGPKGHRSVLRTNENSN